jgi:hypothetical protein
LTYLLLDYPAAAVVEGREFYLSLSGYHRSVSGSPFHGPTVSPVMQSPEK